MSDSQSAFDSRIPPSNWHVGEFQFKPANYDQSHRDFTKAVMLAHLQESVFHASNAEMTAATSQALTFLVSNMTVLQIQHALGAASRDPAMCSNQQLRSVLHTEVVRRFNARKTELDNAYQAFATRMQAQIAATMYKDADAGAMANVGSAHAYRCRRGYFTPEKFHEAHSVKALPDSDTQENVTKSLMKNRGQAEQLEMQLKLATKQYELEMQQAYSDTVGSIEALI
jgi:hypothetical protein